MLTDRAGTTSVAAHHALTAAFCALCRSDLTEVVDILEARIDADGGRGEMGQPLGVAPFLVEAYGGLGRTADAVALSRQYADVTPPSAPSRAKALVASMPGPHRPRHGGRPKGVRAGAPGAPGRRRPVRERPHPPPPRRPAPPRRTAGRRPRAAAHRPRRLRADGAHRTGRHSAAAELAATGATARRRGPDTDQPLTSQETRVALLVAEGRSNREVAAALFLSPKTIERHLSNVFRKRGFKSRTELASAYARMPRADRPDHS